MTILSLQVTVSTTVDSSHGEEATLNEVPLTQHHGKHEIATRCTTRLTPCVTGADTKHEKKSDINEVSPHDIPRHTSEQIVVQA